ncbi:activity-regulated cytoskeleton associated protein 1-like [Aphidius gifuensis]|uniref:activity-regulated cytoskeleton associated protein 1-like n=1 Tax=Aphidius gifuensis TaxID=684658 RepID=UPI001CDC6E51|nr:activity-regulated cytoskeleton associated protein 1-like [Aphidius gifuensis]
MYCSSTFNGDEEAVMSFLERIEGVTTYYQLTQEELIKGIPMFLKDKASEWYRNNIRTWRTWEELAYDLKRYFAPGDIHMQLEDRIRNRVQASNESAKVYVTQLQILMRRHGGMNYTAQLDRLWRNLRPEYKRYIRRNDIYDINDLIRLTDEFERILAEEKNSIVTIEVEPEKKKLIQKNEVAALVNTPFAKYECCWRCG